MHGLFVHECLGCLDCLHVAAPNEEVVSPRKTLDVIMPQARCCVAVGLEYRCTYISIYRYIGVGTPVHLGLSVSWIACTACYNNIVQLGCRLIA